MNSDARPAGVTRRDLLRLLGAAALFQPPAPRTTSIPRGAVVRTILKDVPPSALGNGAILFHEHLSFGSSFFERMRPANAPRPATPPPPSYLTRPEIVAEELRAAGKE